MDLTRAERFEIDRAFLARIPVGSDTHRIFREPIDVVPTQWHPDMSPLMHHPSCSEARALSSFVTALEDLFPGADICEDCQWSFGEQSSVLDVLTWLEMTLSMSVVPMSVADYPELVAALASRDGLEVFVPDVERLVERSRAAARQIAPVSGELLSLAGALACIDSAPFSTPGFDEIVRFDAELEAAGFSSGLRRTLEENLDVSHGFRELTHDQVSDALAGRCTDDELVLVSATGDRKLAYELHEQSPLSRFALEAFITSDPSVALMPRHAAEVFRTSSLIVEVVEVVEPLSAAELETFLVLRRTAPSARTALMMARDVEA